MPERAIGPQAAILALAIVLAAIFRADTLAALIAAYAAAWAAIAALIARGVALPRAPARIVLAIAIAAPLAWLAGRARSIADAELLVGLDVHTADRLRLERTPQIHPAIVRPDRPQLFFVHAPGASEVRIALGSFARIEAEALGHGVFRADYDPRRDGRDPSARSHEIVARLEVDGSIAERGMRSIAPSAHPRWLRVSADRAQACTTSEETGELLVIDRGGVARIPVDGGPSDCAWIGAEIAVARRWESAIAIVASGAVANEIPLGRGQSRVASDGTRLAAIAGDEVVVIEGDRVARRHRLASPDWLAIDGSSIVVAERASARLTWIAGGALGSIALRAPAVTLARAPASGTIVIAATDHAGEGEDPAAHLGNHYVEDQLLAYDAATRALVRQIPTAGRSPRQDAAGGLDRGVSPIGIDEGPDGTLCVAFAGSDELALVPIAGPVRWIDAARAGLSAPSSCAVLADRSIVATSPSSGAVAILAPDGTPRAIERLAPDDAALLRHDPDALRVRFGERAFYEGTRAGISCQSCHLHGASDGLAHNIGGRVLAPTLDVRGIGGTSPYLRDGSYPRIRDLHLVADEIYRGYREPAGDRGRTIEAWLETEPPPLPDRARDPDAERRGLEVFFRAGCPTCHAPPAFTSLGRHPTRAVFPDADAPAGASVDTPSLRGASRRTHLLFDGRARSVSDVLIDHSRAGRHGRLRDVGEADLRDLVRFVESL